MMANERILIVEDDAHVLYSYNRILSESGYKVTAVDSGVKALECLKSKSYNVVLSDIVMEGVDGMQILEETKKIAPETAVILITGYGSIETAIEALRKDAIDYITKPCDNIKLKEHVKRAIDRQMMGEKASETAMQKVAEALGAVAHEINNPLTTIMGYIELHGKKFPKGHTEHEDFSTVKWSAERIAEIIQKMRKIQGIKTKQYTKNSKIIDIQRSSEFTKPEMNTILVVDDEEAVSYSISKFLEVGGYKVDTAISGIEALEKIKEKNYSIVILDVFMPEMDGYETLKRINKYYTDRKVQIPATIMITGYDVSDILQKCKDIGAYTVFHKPLSCEKLIETIKEAENFAGK